MKNLQPNRLVSLYALGLGLVGCIGTEQDVPDEGATEAALCVGGLDCERPRPSPGSLSALARPDLVAEIASSLTSGFACPVGNGQTVTVRVRNRGNAGAGRFVVRTEVTVYTGSQYYTTRRHFLVSSLAAGATTTVGVNLGDGVNAAPGSDGRTTPIVAMQFVNAPNGIFPTATVTQWRALVDTSMGATWYPSGSTFQQISYPDNAVVESNESNNILTGTRSSCTQPSGPVVNPG